MRKFIHFLTLSIMLSVICVPGYSAPEDDYIALRALYLSTDGDNWGDQSNWPSSTFFTANPTMPPGTTFTGWYGVITSPSGTVESLDLYGNNLTGLIPFEIGAFTDIANINLNYNQLFGPIPNTIGTLWNLSHFAAGGNQLGGDIPPDIGFLDNLLYLFLSDNRLTGMIPQEIGMMQNLRYLYLDYNQLFGDIPFQIGNASNLEEIELAANQLTGIIPPEIEFLANLQHLDLSLNQLTGDIPPSFGNLMSLTHLELSNNQITGSIPADLANLTNLQFMLLFNNQLTGCYDPALTSLCGQLDPTYNNNAGISDGNTLDASWEDFCATGNCTAVFDMALNMTLSAGQAPDVAPGDMVSFDITVFNQGVVDAYDVFVTNYLPAGYSFDPALNPGWFDINGDGYFEYLIVGPIPASTSFVTTLTLMVNDPFTGTADDLVTFVEIINAADDNDPTTPPPADIDSSPDNDPTNDAGGTPDGPDDDYTDGDGTGMPLDGVAATDEDDHDPAYVNIITPSIFDLALTTTLSAGQPSSVAPGDAVSFDITVINQGTADAYNILVNDYVPAGYVFDAAMNPNLLDIDADGNPDHMIAGPLTPGVAYMFSIVLIVNNPFTGTPNDLVNYAEISEADNDFDPTNTPPMDIDSSPDNDPTNDAGGTPNGPDDDYTDGDGTGMPLDGMAATDEDDHDPVFVTMISASPCVANDYEALRALYLSTDGDNWANNTNWPDAAFFMTNPTAPPFIDLQSWFGIDTDPTTGCVMNLLLAGNNLNGIIPSEIGMLSNVFLIDLQFNSLTGDIPPEIGNLTSLVLLALGVNQLTGMIPPDLANLSALQFLELHSNQLYGCYDPALTVLCSQLDPPTNNNQYISDGNMLDASWEDFCFAEMGTCTNCITDLTINGTPVPNGIYQVENSIRSSGHIMSGGNVQFKAGQIITLDIGFIADPQIDFSIEIDGCTP